MCCSVLSRFCRVEFFFFQLLIPSALGCPEKGKIYVFQQKRDNTLQHITKTLQYLPLPW